MLTKIDASTIMIVFAGGPHTPERTALACELVASRPAPVRIYLTGAEYEREYSDLAERVRVSAAALSKPPEIVTDTCTSTWASCRHLGHQICDSDTHPQASDPKAEWESFRGEAFGLRPPGSSFPLITVITSNYHAPRVRWLLSGVLGSYCGVDSLSFIVSRDIRWRELFRTSRNRRLIFGECISWLYCLPLGLLYHAFCTRAGSRRVAQVAR